MSRKSSKLPEKRSGPVEIQFEAIVKHLTHAIKSDDVVDLSCCVGVSLAMNQSGNCQMYNEAHGEGS